MLFLPGFRLAKCGSVWPNSPVGKSHSILFEMNWFKNPAGAKARKWLVAKVFLSSIVESPEEPFVESTRTCLHLNCRHNRCDDNIENPDAGLPSGGACCSAELEKLYLYIALRCLVLLLVLHGLRSANVPMINGKHQSKSDYTVQGKPWRDLVSIEHNLLLSRCISKSKITGKGK